ncbi:hypothetical protein Hanom_Chr12g01100951 [Helianthus anomalus]
MTNILLFLIEDGQNIVCKSIQVRAVLFQLCYNIACYNMNPFLTRYSSFVPCSAISCLCI